MQTVFPALAVYFPYWHKEQELALANELNFPAPQLRHIDAARFTDHLPASQLVHAAVVVEAVPEVETVPSLQGLHVETPAPATGAENVPWAQLAQTLSPFDLAYFPAAHPAQVVSPAVAAI